MSAGLVWLNAFVWTLAVELPVYALLLRGRTGPWWAPLALALGANLATHPAFSLWVMWSAPRLPAILCAETAIALLESTLVYALSGQRRSWARALAVGVSANALSLGAGALVSLA